MVIQYNNKTENVFDYRDIINIIHNELGDEVVEVLEELTIPAEDCEGLYYKGTDFIEQGIFSQQIEESGVVNTIVKIILTELEEQGFLKKTMKINKFRIPEAEVIEAIDIELSNGIEKYFNE